MDARNCRSTRSETNVSFHRAILRGLAEDGGLYVPTFSDPGRFRRSAESDSLASTAYYWLRDWVPDLDEIDDFQTLYPFDAPLVELRGGRFDDMQVLELFHGPTLSFKDIGARFLGAALNTALEEERRSSIVLVATSGDTGSAVADALSSLHRVRTILLYPFGQVSAIQERQLTARRAGVCTLAVDGSFDDCQRLVKAAFASPALAEYGLTSANSINIGRLLPQQIYYAWAAHQLESREYVAVVPSGNLGNLAAGFLARNSGVPIGHFVAAHNQNDWFVRFLSGQNVSYPPSKRTLSNAMDVGAPSNAERLKYWANQQDLAKTITGYSVDDASTLETIRAVRDETGYLADPHTAVGLNAAVSYRAATRDTRPIVVLATAHPAKFPDTIRTATGETVAEPEQLHSVGRNSSQQDLIAPNLQALIGVIHSQHLLFA